MSPAAQLILLILLCTGYSDFVYKKAQQCGVPASRFLPLQSITFVLTQMLCCIFFGFQYHPDLLVLGLAGGVMAFAGFGLFYWSMGHGDASVNSTIFRTGFVVTSVLCVAAFRERLSTSRMAGTVAAVAAIVFVSYAPGGRWRRVGAPVLAAICLGIVRFLHKSAGLLALSPWSLLLIQSSVFLLCTQILRWRRHQHEPIDTSTLMYAPVCGVMLSTAAIAGILAFRVFDGSVLTPIAQQGFLVTTPLACAVLKERLDRNKVAGLTLASCAVVLLVA